MGTENKVSFNLKNVHYAPLTATTSEAGVKTYSWAKPVHVAGAVSLALDAEGDTSKFYADGIAYYVSVANNGYSGDLEMARFPEKMLQDLWGFTLDTTDKVLLENASANAKPFALLFEIDGDQSGERYLLYNCTANRPGVGGATTEDTKEPRTQTVTITAAPLEDGRIKAATTSNTPESTKTGWFNAVWEPTT